MSQLATVEHTPAPIRPKTVDRVRIPKRIAKAIRLLATGECTTQKAAAERVGMNASYLCEALKKPKIQAFVTQQARSNLAQGVLRASARIIDLVDGQSEHVSLDAAKHVLAIEGIKPAESSQVSVNVNISPGYVIDMNNPRDVTPKPV